MTHLHSDHGLGIVEWILIVVLVILVIVTIYLLFEPALTNLWQETLESIES